MLANILTIFIPTIFVASITPSICMLLALNVGLRVGLLRSLWMITGELLGVALVFLICGLGTTSFIRLYPQVFFFLKYIGGAYIVWLGVQGILSQGKIDYKKQEKKNTWWGLALQGFLAASLHPKAWLFFSLFIPSFIQSENAILPQVLVLLGIVLLIEFCNLLLYAASGKYLQKMLKSPKNIRMLHRISGGLLVLVGIFLILF
jgi:threonine/homoserine/homoserine lactone efflux protein